MTSETRILLVEDEKKLAGFIRQALRKDGYLVDVCHGGEDGAERALHDEYDALVLDLQLPDRSGLSILREMRSLKKTTPVLVLTARDTVRDRVKGLDEGADDYLTKPFALEELRARLRALVRRGVGGASSVLRYADLTLSLLDRKVARGARTIELTPREFSLLEFFLRNAGHVATRSSIAERVWDYSFEWQSNVVDVFVNSLRRKLEEGGEPRLIHTIRGVGYALREEACT